MSPYHRNVLLEAAYALDHLIWSYRSEIDQYPSTFLTSDDLCLSDFANRSAALARRLIDQDSGRTGERPQFKPPPPQHHVRLRDAIAARRAAREKHAAAAASTTTASLAVAENLVPPDGKSAWPAEENGRLDEENHTAPDPAGSPRAYQRPRPR